MEFWDIVITTFVVLYIYGYGPVKMIIKSSQRDIRKRQLYKQVRQHGEDVSLIRTMRKELISRGFSDPPDIGKGNNEADVQAELTLMLEETKPVKPYTKTLTPEHNTVNLLHYEVWKMPPSQDDAL